MSIRGRVIGTVATLAALAAGLSLTAPAAGAATSTFRTPAYPGDFPDPAVMVAGRTYWAYSTGSAGRNLQVISSRDLKSWSTPSDPLPTLPPWASPGLTWAPGVIPIGGTFVMYYTVHDTALSMQCISVATSPTAGGPFTDRSTGPLVCQTGHGGSIDPDPYLDPSTGQLYLVWKSDDNAIGQPTHIWGQALAPGGLALAAGSSPALLLTQSAAWQAPAVEGPALMHNGSTYYLFYGGNSWNSASSGIGYATSPTLLGSYTNQSRSRPWLATTANAIGPQGPTVFTALNGSRRMGFAAWYGAVGYSKGGVRAFWTGALSFSRLGQPSLS